jgi:PAS domain S-box-containing protein
MSNIIAKETRSGDLLSIVDCMKEQIKAKIESGDVDLKYRELLKAVSAAVYTIDIKGRITFYNQAAVDLWGHSPPLGTSEWCGSWRLYWPDGRPMAHDECPMATALKEGRRIKGAEAIAERPDGTLVPFLAYPTPLYDKAGVLTGALNLLLDISDRKQAEEYGWLLSAIFKSSEDSILSIDIDGIITSANPSAESLFGFTADELVGQPVTILYPPDKEGEETEIIERLTRGESIEHYETIRRRKDGSLVDISLTVSPIRNSAGKLVGASKIARNNTERKCAQERQLLLLREMNHRVKNLFALAGSLVSLSARSAKSAKDLDAAVRGRLAALARAHELTLPELTDDGEERFRLTSLADLIATIFAPYGVGSEHENSRLSTQGPEVQIGGKALTGIALLLHEFATNAAKHGALQTPDGRVIINWSAEDGELKLTWTEQGGPAIAETPKNEGFGSVLARATVTGQLSGRMSHAWTRDGLVIRLSAPLDRLAS